MTSVPTRIIAIYCRAASEPRINVAVHNWVLKIELDGEWEECSFKTRTEALAAFTALTADYEVERAVLLPIAGEMDLESPVAPGSRNKQVVN